MGFPQIQESADGLFGLRSSSGASLNRRLRRCRRKGSRVQWKMSFFTLVERAMGFGGVRGLLCWGTRRDCVGAIDDGEGDVADVSSGEVAEHAFHEIEANGFVGADEEACVRMGLDLVGESWSDFGEGGI